MGLCSSSEATDTDTASSPQKAPKAAAAQQADSKSSSSRAGAPNPLAPEPVPKSGWVMGPSEDVNKHYKMGKQLGQPGQFGYACLAKHIKSGKNYAIKVIKKSRFPKKVYPDFKREIDFLKSLDHPNILKGYEAFETRDELYIVMECCSGGELFDRITARKKYNEKDAVLVFKQLMEGLKHMHSLKIAHCDLKPDNFLFLDSSEESPAKIIDFGMSKHVAKREYLTHMAGTSFYMAPEVLSGQYTWHCDIWSMGVVLFIMLYGFPPFHGSPDREIHDKIKKGFTPEVKAGFGPWFPKATKTSESARDLITKMLTFDPVDRLSAAEVLEHPWMTGSHGSDPLDTVLQHLANFSAEQKLKQALLEKMGAQMDGKDIAALEKSFDKIDENHDGKVTYAELAKALKSVDTQEVKQAETLQELLSTADIDGDGALSLKELTMAAANRRLLAKEERLWGLFVKLDVDGNGTVSAGEIQQALGASDAAEMVAEIDVDGDGQVNYEEFLCMWRDKNVQSEQ